MASADEMPLTAPRPPTPVTAIARAYRRGRAGAVAAAVVLAAGLVTGCGGPTSSVGAPDLRVVAAVWPLAEAARAIGLGNVDVVDPVPDGVDPRSWVPDAAATTAIRQAGLVLDVGGGFTPGFQRVASGVAGRRRLVVVGAAAPGATEVWLDPGAMQDLAPRIAAAMERADPAAAPTFRTGLADWQSSLSALDANFGSTLSACPVHRLVTADASFGVLAGRYGVRVQPLLDTVAPVGPPDVSTTAAEIAVIRASGTRRVWSDADVPQSYLFPALAATGATVAGTLDSLVAAPAQGADSAQSYPALLDGDLGTLTRALSCSSDSTT